MSHLLLDGRRGRNRFFGIFDLNLDRVGWWRGWCGGWYVGGGSWLDTWPCAWTRLSLVIKTRFSAWSTQSTLKNRNSKTFHKEQVVVVREGFNLENYDPHFIIRLNESIRATLIELINKLKLILIDLVPQLEPVRADGLEDSHKVKILKKLESVGQFCRYCLQWTNIVLGPWHHHYYNFVLGLDNQDTRTNLLLKCIGVNVGNLINSETLNDLLDYFPALGS